jgi:hypothetical protein
MKSENRYYRDRVETDATAVGILSSSHPPSSAGGRRRRHGVVRRLRQHLEIALLPVHELGRAGHLRRQQRPEAEGVARQRIGAAIAVAAAAPARRPSAPSWRVIGAASPAAVPAMSVATHSGPTMLGTGPAGLGALVQPARRRARRATIRGTITDRRMRNAYSGRQKQPQIGKVTPLKSLGYFLMHGVVLHAPPPQRVGIGFSPL